MSAHVLKKSALLEEISKSTEAAQQGRKEGQTFSGVLTANSSFLAWLVSLGFGGALLVLYYTHIHYFPDLEWKESLTYLAALSLLGGTVAFLYSLLLFFPGVIWSEFLIHDSEMEDKLCYPDTDHVEPCYRGVGVHMALPFLLFMGAMHFVALLKDAWITATTAIVLLALISWFLARKFQKHIEWKEQHHQRVTSTAPGSLLLKYVGLFNISALISLTSMLFLYALVAPGKGSWRMFLVCTLVVVVANLLVAVQYRRRPGRAAVTAILAAVVLLACGEIKSISGDEEALSSRLMGRFGFGGTRVILIVKDEARGILEGHGVQHEAKAGTVTIRDARILSRLGKEYFVEAGRRRLSISRDLVLSWSAAIAPEEPVVGVGSSQ